MKHSANFFRSVVDSVTEHIAIIDEHGVIRFVNASWVRFAVQNDSPLSEAGQWEGVNYIDVCAASALGGEAHGGTVAAATRRIIRQRAGDFYHEYACHSPTVKRWFMMRITRLEWDGQPDFIVSHQNITERKLAEEQVQALSLSDGLTGVANRRHFDQYLAEEWRRAARLGTPLSMLLLDVDHFKQYNDCYGHVRGDACLRRVGEVLRAFGNRPGDLCARYGGEEFALILGNTDAGAAGKIAENIRAALEGLGIEHRGSTTSANVTASIGVATLRPGPAPGVGSLVEAADKALYAAKAAGRNRVSVSA